MFRDFAVPTLAIYDVYMYAYTLYNDMFMRSTVVLYNEPAQTCRLLILPELLLLFISPLADSFGKSHQY